MWDSYEKRDKTGIPLKKAFASSAGFSRKIVNNRWVKQLIVSLLILLIIGGMFRVNNQVKEDISNLLAYFLLDPDSDWTPALEAMVSSGVWLDSYDRQVFQKEKEQAAWLERPMMSIPVSGKYIKHFGWIHSPVDKQHQTFHSGIDIKASVNSPVRAALPGEVVYMGNDPVLGRMVEIAHGGGLTTVYANCGEILVNSGQKVKQGEIIAKVGKGLGGNGHIHFEVRQNGQAIDPLLMLRSSTSDI